MKTYSVFALFAGALTHVTAVAAPTYFIVGTVYPSREIGWPEHMESYALPLESSDDIAYARNIINGNVRIVKREVQIQVAAGGNGVNREYLWEGAPEWSWHVQHFLGFLDDYFYESDPYSPSRLNEPALLSQAIKDGSWIGQDYTVMAELNPALATQVSRDKAGNLVLDWTRLGPYYA